VTFGGSGLVRGVLYHI